MPIKDECEVHRSGWISTHYGTFGNWIVLQLLFGIKVSIDEIRQCCSRQLCLYYCLAIIHWMHLQWKQSLGVDNLPPHRGEECLIYQFFFTSNYNCIYTKCSSWVESLTGLVQIGSRTMTTQQTHYPLTWRWDLHGSSGVLCFGWDNHITSKIPTSYMQPDKKNLMTRGEHSSSSMHLTWIKRNSYKYVIWPFCSLFTTRQYRCLKSKCLLKDCN